MYYIGTHMSMRGLIKYDSEGWCELVFGLIGCLKGVPKMIHLTYITKNFKKLNCYFSKSNFISLTKCFIRKISHGREVRVA